MALEEIEGVVSKTCFDANSFKAPRNSGSTTTSTILTGAVEESELVACIVGGDRKATVEFVVRYSDRIFAYVWQRMLPRTEPVEDLVQDILLSAWQSLAQYKGESGLEHWLLGIARHRVEDHYRKRLREALEQWSVDDESDPQVGAEPQWDEQLDQQRLLERTHTVHAGLPETYSIALQWRYISRRFQRIPRKQGKQNCLNLSCASNRLT